MGNITVRYLSISALLLCCSAMAYGADSYNPANSQLSIPALMMGSSTFSNVVVTPASIVSIQGGAPNGSVDTYDPVLKHLYIPAVNVGPASYTNVVITVATLVSIGSANWVDIFNPASNQLRISFIQVGGTTYNNVLITVANFLTPGGGMPTAASDQYNPANGQLTIAAVRVSSAVYTNVVIKVGAILSLGSVSRFDDAPVQGLCYSTTPSTSSTDSATNINGQFLYDSGDFVLFWIDGTGGGCTGTSSTDATSLFVGFVKPTGSQSSVLAFSGGLEAAGTLTALNVGTAALMNVGGLVLSGSDLTNVSKFIRKEGVFLPAGANGSVDTFYHDVQADTVLASDSSVPKFVTPVAANASIINSVLANTVAVNLRTTLVGLPGQPTSIAVPPGGQLKFSLTTSRYTCPVCAVPATVYTDGSATFVYLDGHGHVTQFGNPGTGVITTSNLADQTVSGTYTINANVISKSLAGRSASSGDTYTFTYALTENYFDGTTSMSSSPSAFSVVDTSGPYNGQLVKTGYLVGDSVLLTPMTLSEIAGKTIATTANGCQNNENVLTFVGVGPGPTSVTLTQSCGGNLPVTLTTSPIPGVLQGTDTSGYIIYVGLAGAGLVPGAQFVLIQESAGTLGSSGNGNPYQWEVAGPIISVN
jgi:hypothetical protein